METNLFIVFENETFDADFYNRFHPVTEFTVIKGESAVTYEFKEHQYRINRHGIVESRGLSKNPNNAKWHEIGKTRSVILDFSFYY